MVNICKGICKRTSIQLFSTNYKEHKRCSVCEEWFEKSSAIRCICCGTILRVRRKSRRADQYEGIRL